MPQPEAPSRCARCCQLIRCVHNRVQVSAVDFAVVGQSLLRQLTRGAQPSHVLRQRISYRTFVRPFHGPIAHIAGFGAEQKWPALSLALRYLSRHQNCLHSARVREDAPAATILCKIKDNTGLSLSHRCILRFPARSRIRLCFSWP